MNSHNLGTNSQPAKVFYDGLCVVCDKEISQYKKMRGSEKIQFIDIFSVDFNAERENVDPKKIHIEMHAKDSTGQILTGVDAFRLIWSNLDSLNWLATLSRRSPISQMLNLGYKMFVQIRPLLPRKSCETSPLCERK